MTVSQYGGVSYVNAGFVASTTLAALPTASSFPVGTKSFATDIGLNGTEMVVSSSGTWIPHNGRALLSRLTLPVVKSPTIPADASASANGAITFGTAVGTAYAKCFCYFAANVVNGTQPAGFYYMEMSTTTAAIVYNNLYTPAAGTYPTEPTSKTAFAGAVPGGAGSTAAITAFVYTVQGNLLGGTGSLLNNVFSECNAAANNKYITLKVGAASFCQESLLAVRSISATSLFKNISSARQRSHSIFSNAQGTIAAYQTTIDTTANFDVSVVLQLSVATDWLAVNELLVSCEVMS